MEMTSSSPEFTGRVAGAETKVRELAERIEAFFTALAEPPPTPPWVVERPAGPDPAHQQQIERLQRLIRSTQQRADIAENRSQEAEQELEALRANYGKLREKLRKAETPSGIDPATFQELESELETTRLELTEVRKAHGLALDQLAEATAGDGPTEDSVVRAIRAEESVQAMQHHMQKQLLEQEELRRSRDDMRNANQRLRNELRVAQQKRDHFKEMAGDSQSSAGEVERLRAKVKSRDKQVGTLQSEVKALQRSLEMHEKREEHMRRHLKTK
jgi:chromosome segregation ATPase